MSSAEVALNHGTDFSTGRINRWSVADPCGVCGGHQSAPQGRGERCYGFLSSDGKYSHCTREEHAGSLAPHNGGTTFAHRTNGDCRCGLTHGNSATGTAIRSPRKTVDDQPKPWAIPDAHVEMFHRYELAGELQFEIARIWKQHRSQHGGAKTFPRYVGQDGSWYFGQGRCKGQPDKPLYRQDEATNELRLGGKVFICEGERDCDSVWDATCIAVCNPDGAGSFQDAQASLLIEAMREGAPSAEIDIIADNDSAGIDHARKVRRMLAVDANLRRRIRIVRPPDGCKDISELLVGRPS
jgi:hypothetical protein